MFSGGAMWTFIVAAGWLVFEESESSSWVGIVTFFSMLPHLIAAPVGGLMGDIYDRRKLVLVSFGFSAAIVASLAALVASGQVQLWHVAALAFIEGTARNIREPSMSALVPNQVPREDLLNALVLSGASRHGARFFGLLIAAPLLAIDVVGVGGVLAISALFHVLGAIEMARTRTISTGETSPGHGLVRGMVDGLAYIYTNQTIALFVVLVAFHCALVMSFESILPVFSSDRLGATDGSLVGYLVMGFGAGAVVGLFALAGIRDEKRKGQLLWWTGIGSGIAPALLALSDNLPLALLFSVAMGLTQATFMALTNMYVQVMAPDRLRARISSLYALHAGGVMAFANLGYGFMADAFSAPPILAVTGVLFIIVVVSLGMGQPVLRQVYRTGHVVAA